MDLKVSHKVVGSLQAVDKFGNPSGGFDAAPSWSMSDESLASLEVAEDGLSATITPKGALGSGSVSASAMAGGNSISGSVEINFQAGDVAAISISLSEPTPA